MIIPSKIPRTAEGISVKALLDLVPQSLIDELAEQLFVDKWVRKLKGDYFFKLILFSILSSERLSLRVMEDNFEDPLFRVLAPALEVDEVTFAGIRARLMNVNSIFFKKLYEAVYKRCQELYGGKVLEGYHIKRYDSTMIATFSHLLEGMKVGNTKKGKTQVKLTAEFDDDFLIRMEFYKDQAHLSEETALKEVIEKVPNDSKSIRVFDKGLKSRQTFECFENNDIIFVGRVGENVRYELVRPYLPDDQEQDNEEIDFVQDSVVRLYKSGHDNLTEKEFRLIQFHLKKEGKMIFFVTNVWDISAATIAAIYKQRWDIEVLFRFMKQEMNLTHFVCNDSNAIQVMLHITMIASMLVLIYKKKNNIKSYKKAKIQFFKELVYSILLEALDDTDKMQRLKANLRKFTQNE